VTIAAMQSFNFLGAPEGYLALAQACIYLTLSEKSNTVYTAYSAVTREVRTEPEYPVPLHIRNAPTKLMKELGYGDNYLYPHNYEGGMVKQDYLPKELQGRRYYHPKDRGHEKKLKEFLEKARKVHGDNRE